MEKKEVKQDIPQTPVNTTEKKKVVRKKKPTIKKTDNKGMEEQIKQLLTVTFTVAGAKNEIWILQPDEITMLSLSLNNVLKNIEIKDSQMAYTSLISCCIIIFIPRLIQQFNKNKEKSKNEQKPETNKPDDGITQSTTPIIPKHDKDLYPNI